MSRDLTPENKKRNFKNLKDLKYFLNVKTSSIKVEEIEADIQKKGDALYVAFIANNKWYRYYFKEDDGEYRFVYYDNRNTLSKFYLFDSYHAALKCLEEYRNYDLRELERLRKRIATKEKRIESVNEIVKKVPQYFI
jgi:hypothetical protein